MPSAEVTTNSTLLLNPGKPHTVNIQTGQHYRVRKPGKTDDASDLQVPDNVIATRQGDTLHLRYSDGSTANFEGFYSVCKDASLCSVNVASDSEAGMTLSAEEASGGITKADGGTLVYAHGSHEVLMAMAQDQAQLLHTFSTLGDAAVLTYLPHLAEVGYFAAFSAQSFNLAAASASSGGTQAVGGTLLGVIQAGPVVAGNDLKVNVFAADGTTVLAQNVSVDSSGHFSASMGNYAGMVIVKLLNTGPASIAKHQVAIYGDALDTATIGAAGWTDSGTVVSYAGHNLVVYNSNTSAAQLYIEQAMVTASHVL